MTDIKETLAQRQTQHGDFKDHAFYAQLIKTDMKFGNNWANLAYVQKECLEMIAHKIGRILAGDPDYIDHWHDIAGYATLVEQYLEEKQKQAMAEKQQLGSVVAVAARANSVKLRRGRRTK